MPGPILAKDIMVTKLVTLAPSVDVFDAIALLLKHKISGAPVVDEQGGFVGVFSEKDCLSLLVAAVYEQLPNTKIAGFVETDARTVDETADLLSIAQIFLSTSFRRLPVVRDGKLVGQISRRDVLRAAHDSVALAVAEKPESAILYLSSLMERNESPIG